MTVALVTVADGRHEYHHRSIASALESLPRFDEYIFVNDEDHNLGFAGSVQRGFERVIESGVDHVFWLEADFTFNQPVPVSDMIELLDRAGHLVQVALKRQPWNREEKRAGGIVELNPGDFHERADGDVTWTEHRRFFTTNPCVFHAHLCRSGWPQVTHSEGIFTHQLIRDTSLQFAFWGAKYAAPLVTHIGAERTGGGY